MEGVRLFSPREVAEAFGVSESSLKRWVDAGKIVATRTEGGHRRIALAEAVRYVREHGAPLAHPEILDLPEIAAGDGDHLGAHLEAGDALAVRGWLIARYLRGATLAELCDGPIREAMYAIGELWHGDARGIFIEHRGTDICLQALSHLRTTLTTTAEGPVALGGAPEDDPYILPSFMAAMVTSAAGMRAVNLGPDCPLPALQAAVAAHRPRLVWLSASAPVPAARARALGDWMASLPASITAVVGGRESASIRSARRADTMVELADIAGRLASRTARPAPGHATR